MGSSPILTPIITRRETLSLSLFSDGPVVNNSSGWLKLDYGVMVTHQVLVLIFLVRIRVVQQI